MGKTFKGEGKLRKKIAEKKKKIARKAKGCASMLLCAFAIGCIVSGCMDTNPASRQTYASYGDIEPTVKIVFENATGNTVKVDMPITLGDGALASADSTGSTETQTATPTLDVRTRIDAKYNDALAAASTASKGVLETLMSASANKVLDLMSTKSSGTVKATRLDGSTVDVTCKDGQCYVGDYDPDAPTEVENY